MGLRSITASYRIEKASGPVKCIACEHDNPAGNRFCGSCGLPLERPCPSCHRVNPLDTWFCGRCGTALATSITTQTRATPGPRETQKHLADKIRQSKSAIEGERKQVTVLFADVKGSMELAEALDPEAFSHIMSRFFAI